MTAAVVSVVVEVSDNVSDGNDVGGRVVAGTSGVAVLPIAVSGSIGSERRSSSVAVTMSRWAADHLGWHVVSVNVAVVGSVVDTTAYSVGSTTRRVFTS